ncbi:hypothetical protein Q8F57_045675 [Paraburkholderia terrae]|uniref:hypothetical protein n=1 Tax=Paraburkholderia terrae TaxID=311230 RepID=UPI00296B172D|nr:hypothetical protein [Paraburkholderia terrae]MDW3660675.1 hypothetical protein [Paraburkholderia terrae]
MVTVNLLHNDDEVLDPSDSSLRTRGTVQVNGHGRGGWEEHLDGTWTALIDGASLQAQSRQALVSQIESHLAGAG